MKTFGELKKGDPIYIIEGTLCHIEKTYIEKVIDNPSEIFERSHIGTEGYVYLCTGTYRFDRCIPKNRSHFGDVCTTYEQAIQQAILMLEGRKCFLQKEIDKLKNKKQ